MGVSTSQPSAGGGAVGGATAGASIGAVAGPYGAIAGAVIGAVYGGIAGGNQARYQAAVARANEAIENNNQAQAVNAGESTAEINDLKTGSEVGAAKAAQASRGIATNVGTAASVTGDIQEAGRINSMTIRSNAQRQGYGSEVAAEGARSQAALDSLTAKNAMTSSLISGAGQVGSIINQYQKEGVGSGAAGVNPYDYGTGFGGSYGSGDLGSGGVTPDGLGG